MASKQIKISFYSDGSVNQSASEAIGIRQGDSNGAVAIVAAFAGKRNDQYVCKLNFERPDGKHIANVLMSEDASDSTAFVYSVGSSWFFAVSGNARLTVTLTDQSGAIAAQGSYSFRIEPTEVVVADSTLTYDEAAALEGLIAEIDADAVKRATSLNSGYPSLTLSGFLDLCIARKTPIEDGDRYVATGYTGQTNASILHEYYCEFLGDNKAILVDRQHQNLSTDPQPTVSVHIAARNLGSQTWSITAELASKAYADRNFDGDSALKAIADEDGNNIVATYETKADANSKNTTLLSYFTDGKANFALADADGNSIIATYETKADSQAKDATAVHKAGAETITGSKTFNAAQYFERENQFAQKNYFNKGINVSGGNLVLGTLIGPSWIETVNTKLVSCGLFGKANYLLPHSYGGNGGSDVDYTFAMTDDVAAAVERSNLVSIIQEATQSLSGLMSATDKSRLDALYALLGDTEDADTVVDTINEVLAIFNQYPEGASLVNALAQKVSIADIVDALTSDDPTKPLSAKQGKVLKALIDDTLATFVAEDSAFNRAEAERVTAENGRVAAENARVAAENERAAEFSGWQDEIDSKLTRGDYDATTGVGYADNADQLNSPDVTTDQAPYLYRTSGGDADIGNREKDTIVGGSLGWNQLVADIDYSNNGDGFDLAREANTHKVTISGTASNNSGKTFAVAPVGSIPAGHKVLLLFNNYSKTGTDTGGYYTNTTYADYKEMGATDPSRVITATINQIQLIFAYSSGRVYGYSFYINIFDLTAIFGATIADYIYSLETANAGAGVAWFKRYFPKPYYPYKAIGGFLHVKLTSHDMVGFNQWDEEWEVGDISNNTGQNATHTTRIRSKNYIPVLPSTSYYFKGSSNYTEINVFAYDANKNFIGVYVGGNWVINSNSSSNVMNSYKTLPAGAAFIRIKIDGTATYHNDVNINLSWSGWRNGQYEAYKKVTYPLDTSVILRGIPKLDANNNLYYDGDVYHSDGSVEENYVEINLGEINYASVDGNGWVQSEKLNYIYTVPNTTTLPDAHCASYIVRTPNNTYSMDGSICVGVGGRITIRDPQFIGKTLTEVKSLLSGKKVIAKRLTTTISQADPFQETQAVDDFGTEEYVVPEQDGVQVPVGHYTEYPENLRDKLRRLPNMPTISESTTATYAVNYNGQTKKCSFVPINDWLVANGYPAVQDVSDQITDVAGLTYAIKKAYKVGNLVSLTIKATNSTGNTISSFASLADLAQGLRPSTNLPVASFIGETSAKFIVHSDGYLSCPGEIANGSTIYIVVTYAVA